MEEVECVVVGAGVVGLAVARALALEGREVLILEKNATFGAETSSRNSEVIHAGIYYPKGSLMARLCIAGREALYAFSRDHGVQHRKIGKLVVATTAEEAAQLESIRGRAAANGVDDLRAMSAEEARALEPELRCEGALLSPSTGIIDSHGYMLALLGDAERAGATLVCRAPVDSAGIVDGGFDLDVGGSDPMKLRCRLLVNSAGLDAPALARAIKGMPPE